MNGLRHAQHILSWFGAQHSTFCLGLLDDGIMDSRFHIGEPIWKPTVDLWKTIYLLYSVLVWVIDITLPLTSSGDRCSLCILTDRVQLLNLKMTLHHFLSARYMVLRLSQSSSIPGRVIHAETCGIGYIHQ